MRNLVLLAIVNLFWAIQFPASRVAAQELGGMTITWFAMLMAALLLAPLAWMEGRQPKASPIPSRGICIRDIALLGISGSLIAQLCLNWGLERSPATNASVVYLSVPVLMALLASILLGERMSRLRWVAFSVSIPGVLLASDIRWSETSFLENRYLLGNALVFLSCLGSAFYNVFSKRVLNWIGPAQLVVATFCVSLVVLLPAMLINEPHPLGRLAAASRASIFSLFVIGFVCLAVSMLLFFRVLGEVDATQASISIYFLPLFGVILSSWTLNESVSASLLIGGLLVAAGAWIVTVSENQIAKEGQ